MPIASQILLSVLGCGIENTLSEKIEEAEAPEETAPPGPEYVDDIFYQVPTGEVDTLFVIDNSGSMYDKQSTLSSNLPSFFSNFEAFGINYHIGAVTTDMSDSLEKGQLQPSYGFPFVTPDTQTTIDAQQLVDDGGNALTTEVVFKDMVNMGITGSATEKGLDATYYALSNYQGAGEANEGFLRSTADLHVIVLSDEEDYSTEHEPQDVIDLFTTLQSQKNAFFHSIVALSGDTCAYDEGTRYIQVSNALLGTTASICSSDWDDMLDGLGLAAAGLSREFYLTKTPVIDTIEMGVYDENPDGSGQYDLLYEPTIGEAEYDMVEYVPTTNSLRFKYLNFIPPANSEVRVHYEVDTTPADTGTALDTGDTGS